MRLFVCMLSPLVQKNYIAPCDGNLYYAVCRFYCFTITSSYNAQVSLTLNDLTLLEAIFIALLHR